MQSKNREVHDIATHISLINHDIRLIISNGYIYVMPPMDHLCEYINVIYKLDKKKIDTKRTIFQLFCSILNGEKFSKLDLYDLVGGVNYLDEQEETVLKNYIVTIDDNNMLKIKYRNSVYQAISDIIYTLSTLLYLIDISFSIE
jgi:hypothetical protein